MLQKKSEARIGIRKTQRLDKPHTSGFFVPVQPYYNRYGRVVEGIFIDAPESFEPVMPTSTTRPPALKLAFQLEAPDYQRNPIMVYRIAILNGDTSYLSSCLVREYIDFVSDSFELAVAKANRVNGVVISWKNVESGKTLL